MLDHQLAARGWVGVLVGGDHPLVDAPGGLDLDVLIDSEQGGQAVGLLVGEQLGAGMQGAPRRSCLLCLPLRGEDDGVLPIDPRQRRERDHMLAQSGT